MKPGETHDAVAEAFEAIDAGTETYAGPIERRSNRTQPATAEPSADEARDDRHPRRSQATELVDLAREAEVELWHTPTGDPYGTVRIEGHREHHPLRRIVRDYLAREYYARHRRATSSAALTDAYQTLSGQARYDGATHAAAVRLATHDDRLYLDLGDPAWTVITIDATGWRVTDAAPVRHWRPGSLRPLPRPIAGGTLDALRALWPALDDDAWTLLASWLVAALAPQGPYPVLIETGEQGAGKSTLGRMLRDLIDPASPALRGVPRDERDVMIGALTSYIVALDNLSGLPVWLSDTLCRVATGGGLATRTLYSDLDETLIDVTRPILLTGIDSPATRGDLLDRALAVHLPALQDDARRDEAALWAQYHALRPALLGALLDAAVCALRHRAGVTLPRRPRMADACTWVTAAEPALLWTTGRTLKAWLGARDAASADLLATDPIAQAILALSLPWRGTAAELLERLTAAVSERHRTARTWPTSPRGLASALRRLAPDLRRAGVEVQEPIRAGHTRQRTWTIVRIVRTEPDSPDSARQHCADRADGRADGCPADRPRSSASSALPTPHSRDSGLFSASADDADGADGCTPSLSGGDSGGGFDV